MEVAIFFIRRWHSFTRTRRLAGHVIGLDRRRPVRREGGTGETAAYAVLVPKKHSHYLQTPPQSSVFTTNVTAQNQPVHVFKTHHNFQFSPQMTALNRRESMSSKRISICSFHHKYYSIRAMRDYVFKSHHDLCLRLFYVFITHRNFQFSPQML